MVFRFVSEVSVTASVAFLTLYHVAATSNITFLFPLVLGAYCPQASLSFLLIIKLLAFIQLHDQLLLVGEKAHAKFLHLFLSHGSHIKSFCFLFSFEFTFMFYNLGADHVRVLLPILMLLYMNSISLSLVVVSSFGSYSRQFRCSTYCHNQNRDEMTNQK